MTTSILETSAAQFRVRIASQLVDGLFQLVVLVVVFLSGLRWFRVELKGIEPSASRVRFTRPRQKRRGTRKVPAPGGGEDDPPTDGDPIPETASWRFWNLRLTGCGGGAW